MAVPALVARFSGSAGYRYIRRLDGSARNAAAATRLTLLLVNATFPSAGPPSRRLCAGIRGSNGCGRGAAIILAFLGSGIGRPTTRTGEAMPTLLDDVLETHIGPEPRVDIFDVQLVLQRVIRPEDEDTGESVSTVAGRCRPPVSTRTVYRALKPGPEQTTMSLAMADRLLVACGSHLAYCRLHHADGRITKSDDTPI